MTAAGWLVGLLALAAPFAEAAAPTPSLTAWHGTWSGEGAAFGKAATATLVIGPAPEDGATALSYRLSAGGTPPIAYSAEAMYRVDGRGRVRGNWTDNRGRTRPIGGRIDGSEWHNIWGSADVEIGRSTYRLETPDRLVVSDSVLQDDGSWRSFATMSYQRKR